MFNQKSILITGGTGLFGREYTRKILQNYKPEKIIIFSRDELKQYEMQQEFNSSCMRYFIGDIRDFERLSNALSEVDFIIHAASMKHLPSAEYNPMECIKTNIYGSENVIKAALKNNVNKVIALSSAKPSSPTNLNDATRLTSEKLFVSANNMVGKRDARFSVVRYSPLIGTDESLVHFLREARQNNKRSDNRFNVEPFLEDISKSVDFVLKNFARMQGGEIFVSKEPPRELEEFETSMLEVSQKKLKNYSTSREVVSIDEIDRSLEFEDHFVICPTVLFANKSDFTKNNLGETGRVISYGKQDINQADIHAVVNVLRSDYLTQGPAVPNFEENLANYCGADFGVAANSATSALHIACLALELKEGDLLWTSPNTFVASANCGLYCGASIDFVDIDPKTYNMCSVKLEQKLILAEKENKLPKIVIPVHLAGQSCDMSAIHELSKKYGFKIIEDASHAIGGKYLDKPIGNCQYSDITVFSFHPVKIITTAEGGLATTNSSELAEKMQLFRSHGVTRNRKLMTHDPDGDWYYQQVALGLNYRMTEMQAALGISQLQRLDQFVTSRHELAERYDSLLDGLPIQTPYRHTYNYSAFHLYPILLKLDEINKTHKQVFSELRKNGIGVNLHYIPVHTQPFYTDMGFAKGDFPIAENYYERAISIPMYSSLSITQQDQVVDVLRKVIK